MANELKFIFLMSNEDIDIMSKLGSFIFNCLKNGNLKWPNDVTPLLRMMYLLANKINDHFYYPILSLSNNLQYSIAIFDSVVKWLCLFGSKA